MKDVKIKCERCNGRGYKRVRFYYKEKSYYYYVTCYKCFGKGYTDWISYVMRGHHINGIFVETHPAGSCIFAAPEHGGCKVYDGLKYISTDTKRGEAIWNELIGPIEK